MRAEAMGKYNYPGSNIFQIKSVTIYIAKLSPSPNPALVGGWDEYLQTLALLVMGAIYPYSNPLEVFMPIMTFTSKAKLLFSMVRHY